MKLNKKYSILSILTLISSPTYSQLYLCKACSQGTYAAAGASSCTTCSAGTYSYAGAASCTPCPAGEYQDASGQSSCKRCPDGQYQPNSGSSSCLSCTSTTEYCDYKYTERECKTDQNCVTGCSGISGNGMSLKDCEKACYKCKDGPTKTAPGHIDITRKPNSDKTGCVEVSRSNCIRN